MAVRTYAPRIKATLIKLVARQNGVATRYTAAPRQIDLTPYLGDNGAVRTVKALSSPAGAFTIALPDQPDAKLGDSLYALVEPMDVVEIRASRHPEQYAGQDLPLIMRGFVSSVRRSEAIDQDGSPQRFVVIEGQDAGKLWLMNQIYFEIAILTDNAYLSAFRLQVATGIDVALLPVSAFVRQLTDQVINAKIAKLAAFAQQAVKPFLVDASVTHGITVPQRLAGFDQVPVWSLIEAFADRPWNEAFIQDQEDGPHLVFRPAPYKDITGAFIMPDAADPGTVLIGIDDVASLDVARSDARIANFFWTPPGDSMLDSDLAVTVASLLKGEPLDFQYANNAPELYGVRKMVAASALLPDSLSSVPSMVPPADRAPLVGSILLWNTARARQLKLMNRDNGVFEEGFATLKGNEALAIGKYLRVVRGDMVAEYYVERVAHTFAPFQTWTTDVAMIRGTGFLVRSKLPGSPYYAEGRAGPYTRTDPVALLNALQKGGGAPSRAFSLGGYNFGAVTGGTP